MRVISSDEENNITKGTEIRHVRKRGCRNEKNYTQNLNKDKRNSGNKYVTVNSKIIFPKKIVNRFCCLKNCVDKISSFDRQLIFDNFWKLANFRKQNLFLHTTVKRETPKKRRPRNYKSEPRQCQFKYYLTHENVSVLVCKKFFLDTFNISEGRLARALKKDVPGEDMRGKSENSRRKTEESLLIAVKEHIQSFPAFTSHYTRAHNPHRKYLSPDLNIKKMYNLYLEKCKTDKQQHVNEWIYRKIFKNDFNLHFHKPRKDTCQKCDFLQLKIEACEDESEKKQLKLEHDFHLRSAEKARKCLEEDQKKAAENPDKYFGFSFDFQKALPFPKLTTSISYYKRNMYVLNLGFHNFHNKNIDMYLWDETIASRGSQEVASCCIKHLQKVTTQKHIIAYSDSCTGQNRNIKLALTWMKIVQSSENDIEIVDHKFLISGHSYLPNDRDFGVIEIVLRKTNVLYTPNDYYSVIAACGRKSFTVHNMEKKDFISTQSLEKSVSKRTKNTDQNEVNWLKIQWIRFYHDIPYKMFYKLTLDENDEFLTLDLSPKRGRPRRYSQIEMAPLYAGSRPVTSAKYKDMMDLLNYIPPIYHNYFKNLKQSTISEDLINPINDED